MELRRIDENSWEIPAEGPMRVPAVVYASARLLEDIRRDQTLAQARNVACLPGLVRRSYVMPDAHQGYGFPIGGVAAFDPDEGIISPGGVGYDINCGVRLLRTDFTEEEVEGKRRELLAEIFKEVPAGVGKGGVTRLSRAVLKDILRRGAEWAVENGYGRAEDLERTEERGRMKDADVEDVSARALERGIPQLGTLGAGNHFLEIQKVREIYDPAAARAFGLTAPGQVMVMVHCGSRGLGHQVATDFIETMENAFGVAGLPDRELVNAPFRSTQGQRYYRAMCAAVNYAFANRQMIAHWVRDVFARVLGGAGGMDQVYDVCHNVAKVEEHEVDGRSRRLVVHRKGATRSFGPGRPEVPAAFRGVGQPVIIPGSMGTASFLLAGTAEAEALSFASTAHGAGRVMSRHEALRRFRGEKIRDDLARRGIELKSTSWKGVAEEAAEAYKDVEEVVRVSNALGLGRVVARLLPIGVMKG
ncbi:MAG TPA: RtcB family protein [Candidatus Aminicenantes bacterium]|nr:RtcB family protein [Candidatus Aminicenantes bacterium]HRY66328.1 RtcB family protein [Candidatus Aminicenantes bacterium]HRZ73225.1 RtcB family protein [Candidatus Aminicenantes bacterium]